MALTLWGTYVFITRRGTFLQICKVGDYRRSDGAILKVSIDSDTKSNSLSFCQLIFSILQSLWKNILWIIRESSGKKNSSMYLKRDKCLRIMIHYYRLAWFHFSSSGAGQSARRKQPMADKEIFIPSTKYAKPSFLKNHIIFWRFLFPLFSGGSANDM